MHYYCHTLVTIPCCIKPSKASKQESGKIKGNGAHWTGAPFERQGCASSFATRFAGCSMKAHDSSRLCLIHVEGLLQGAIWMCLRHCYYWPLGMNNNESCERGCETLRLTLKTTFPAACGTMAEGPRLLPGPGDLHFPTLAGPLCLTLVPVVSAFRGVPSGGFSVAFPIAALLLDYLALLLLPSPLVQNNDPIRQHVSFLHNVRKPIFRQSAEIVWCATTILICCPQKRAPMSGRLGVWLGCTPSRLVDINVCHPRRIPTRKVYLPTSEVYLNGPSPQGRALRGESILEGPSFERIASFQDHF